MKMWICRSRMGMLKISNEKPCLNKDGTMWEAEGCGYYLPFEEFPEVTFENSPQEIELKLVEK